MDTEFEERDRRLRDAIESAIGLLHKFVIPVYRLNQRGRPEQFASGFIVKFDKGHLFVSAAHVIREAPERELFYYIEPRTTRKLTGTRILGRVADGEEDRLDVGGVLLSEEHRPPYPAVEKFAVDQSYIRPTYLPRVDKEYVVVGFPASKSKRNPIDKSIRVEAYAYHSPIASPELYAACGVEHSTHLVLPFDQRRGFDSMGKQINLPKPQGMSGAPFWVLFEGPDEQNRVFPLVAVGTTYRRSQKAMIATDSRVVLDMIDALR